MQGTPNIGSGSHTSNARIGDNTPHFLYHIPNFTMITDIDGKARANYTMYGQFPQSNGSIPSISITTDKYPRSSFIYNDGHTGLASYAEFVYGSLRIFYIPMLSIP